MEQNAALDMQKQNNGTQEYMRRRDDSITISDQSNCQLRINCDFSKQEETCEKIDQAVETMRYLKYKFYGWGKP